MKKIIEEFFQLTYNGKIREKALLTRIAMSAVLVVLCMAAMSITAYAYFSASVTANVSPVQSAVWKITAEPEQDVLLENGAYVMDNRAGTANRDFRFLLKKAADATATVGYVKIDIKTDVDQYTAAQTYFSQPIGQFLQGGTMIEDLDRELKIAVPVGKIAYVSFIGEWGTCAKQPVIEELQVIVPQYGATVELPTEPETTEPETTEPETTEAATEPETTVAATEPETTAAPTEPETTVAATEPETTDAPTEPETTVAATEPETTAAPTEPETTVAATEPETTAAPTEPETTVAATEPETTAAPTEPETTVAATEPETTLAPTEPATTVAPTEHETTGETTEP